MKHFSEEGGNRLPKYDESFFSSRDDYMDPMKDYEFSAFHGSDDEHDSMADYEFSITNHED